MTDNASEFPVRTFEDTLVRLGVRHTFIRRALFPPIFGAVGAGHPAAEPTLACGATPSSRLTLVLQSVLHLNSYEGIPLSELRIDIIEWTPERSAHIRTRSARYARPNEFDVEPEWATEAALDPVRLVSTTAGKSIEVIGLSRSAPPRQASQDGRLLKVWLYPKDHGRGH